MEHECPICAAPQPGVPVCPVHNPAVTRYEFEMPKRTRARKSFDELPKWKQLKVLDQTEDQLAARLYFLEHEGREMVQNVICSDHGLPKRY